MKTKKATVPWEQIEYPEQKYTELSLRFNPHLKVSPKVGWAASSLSVVIAALVAAKFDLSRNFEIRVDRCAKVVVFKQRTYSLAEKLWNYIRMFRLKLFVR